MKPLFGWENNIEFLFIDSMEKRRVKTAPFVILLAFQYFPFPSGRQCRGAPPKFPPKNKGFINYVSYRNWAVRNPAETRLDSLAW